MFNQYRLKEVLAEYKQNFVSKQWGEEKYKWEAVKWFQDNWDVKAPDFAEMLSRSLDRTFNLLASVNNFPKGMIVGFAKAAPEDVRAMFIDLFDESKDVFERMNAFKLQSSILLERHGNGAAQHYQYENAISTYLWLRYPDKYYIYKFGEVKTVASELESDYKFKKGAYADNVRSFLRFYDEISEALKQDTELVNLFQSQLTETCYPDPELKTLTIDVGFYISRMFSQNKQDNNSDDEDALDGSDPSLFSEEWFPSLEEYTPGFTKEKWLELLNSKKIIGPVWGGVLAAFYEAGGAATCTQIAQKYNKNASSISGNCTQLAKKIYKETQCPLSIRENGKNRYWPILFQGKDAGADVAGGYIWKLRPELYDALTEFDIMRFQWKSEDEPEPGEDDAHYWWLNANPKIWSYANIGVGEVQSYTLFNENGNKRRIFQNFLDAKPGDMVIGYETTPVKQIVALAKISAAQDGEKLYFEKVEGLTSPIDYSTLRDCPELAEMEYFQNPQGSLYRLSKAEYDFIIDLIREENPLQAEDKAITYSKNDFLNEVYMTEEAYESLVAVIYRNLRFLCLCDNLLDRSGRMLPVTCLLYVYFLYLAAGFESLQHRVSSRYDLGHLLTPLVLTEGVSDSRCLVCLLLGLPRYDETLILQIREESVSVEHFINSRYIESVALIEEELVDGGASADENRFGRIFSQSLGSRFILRGQLQDFVLRVAYVACKALPRLRGEFRVIAQNDVIPLRQRPSARK